MGGGGAVRVAVSGGGRLGTSITRAACSPGGEGRHVVKFDRLLCVDAGVREHGGGGAVGGLFTEVCARSPSAGPRSAERLGNWRLLWTPAM